MSDGPIKALPSGFLDFSDHAGRTGAARQAPATAFRRRAHRGTGGGAIDRSDADVGERGKRLRCSSRPGVQPAEPARHAHVGLSCVGDALRLAGVAEAWLQGRVAALYRLAGCFKHELASIPANSRRWRPSPCPTVMACGTRPRQTLKIRETEEDFYRWTSLCHRDPWGE